MKTERTTRVFGLRVYGVGVAALGLACLAFGDFDPGQMVPRNFPARTPLAYCAGALMVVAASAIEWRRTRAWGAAALIVYYSVFVLLLMHGRLLLSGFGVYGTYEDIAMQVAIAASALIVYAISARSIRRSACASHESDEWRLTFVPSYGEGRILCIWT